MNDSSTTILVVDDDQDIRDNLSDILDDLGYVTESAQNGNEALTLLREKPFDIAILDFKMPGIDGATLFREIQSLYPKTRSIMITAHAGTDGVSRALTEGIWRVLRKPVDVKILLATLKDARKHKPD